MSSGKQRAMALFTAAGLLCGCAASGGGQPSTVLQEYRLHRPTQQVVAPVWLSAFTTDELYGSLDPSGRRLLFAGNQKGNFDIWIKDLATGTPTRLTVDVAEDTQPAFDPSGKRIVFVSTRKDAKGDIYLDDDGKVTRLTDETTADHYPVFSPDGRAIYFVSGPEGMSRIDRLELATRARSRVLDAGTTHPALSPDGRWLAYTRFDSGGIGRIELLELGQRRTVAVVSDGYHAGFPSFSRNGLALIYVRFMTRAPGESIDEQTPSQLMLAPLDGLTKNAPLRPQPLTSGRVGMLFPHASSDGLVVTVPRGESLDLALIPAQGPVPTLATANAQLALALEQADPRDRLLCLAHVIARGEPRTTAEALYLAAETHKELGEFVPAQAYLARLAADEDARAGEARWLARIDQVVLPIEALAYVPARSDGGKPSGKARPARKVPVATVQQALARLGALALPPNASDRVKAHQLLRQGDLLRFGAQLEAATKSYQLLLARYRRAKDVAAAATFRLGQVLGTTRDGPALFEYYRAMFTAFAGQQGWLLRAATEMVALSQGEPEGQRIQTLRAQLDRAPDATLFQVLARAEMARRYEAHGELDLSIAALAQAARVRGPGLENQIAAATFELGRVCLKNYEALRAKGRTGEALRSYEAALEAYASLMKRYQPGNDYFERARREYTRLGLLMGAELEQSGERALSVKQYQRMLEVDPEVVQAHRRLITLGVRAGEREALTNKYKEAVRKDSGNFVGHYALGYLATLAATVDKSALDRAQAHLERAIGLNPASPFGHMTLGWVQEMRERLLGETGRGWLEEAIVSYERAYHQNDAKQDLRTEGDLLVNLCNVFANLGNGWQEAYEYCDLRRSRGLAFLEPAQEAFYHLTFGRSATAEGHYDQAEEELLKALDLARDLKNKPLEAEVIARLGLALHLAGDYAASTRELLRAMALYRAIQQPEKLSTLQRTIAQNRVLAGEHAPALDAVDQTAALAKDHPVAEIEDYKPSGDPGRGTLPFGFVADDQRYVAASTRARVYGQLKAFPEAVQARRARFESRRAVSQGKGKGDDELGYELALLQNDLGLGELALGDPEAFHKALAEAHGKIRAAQTDEKDGYKPGAYLLALELGLSLNRAEQVLDAFSRGELPRARLGEVLAELTQLEQEHAARELKQAPPLLSERLQLGLQGTLAQLEAYGFVHGVSVTQASAKTAPNPAANAAAAARAASKDQRAKDALARIEAQGELLTRAIFRLQKLVQATKPANVETADGLATLREKAREQGVLEPLFRPLSAQERLRTHVIAGLLLADISVLLTPRAAHKSHPSTELLLKLTQLGASFELDDLRYVAAAKLALRRNDLAAAVAAVDGFLSKSPLLLPAAYRTQAERIRAQIFEPAILVALTHGETERVLMFVEQWERRALLDDIWAAAPAGFGRVREPVNALLSAAAAYRVLLGKQDPAAPEAAHAAYGQKLNAIEQRYAQALAALAAKAPRVAALFRPAPVTRAAVQAALEPGQRVLRAFRVGDQAFVALVEKTGPVKLVEVPAAALLPAPTPPRTASGSASSTARAPRPALATWLATSFGRELNTAKRIYADLAAIGGDAPARALIRARVPVVEVVTLEELLDAFAVRNLSFEKGVVAALNPADATPLATALGFSTLAGPAFVAGKIDRVLEQAGVVVLADPLRFDGGSPANVRLQLHDPQGQRFADLRLARALGLPLRGQLVALTTAQHVPGSLRRQRVALMALLHAAGAPAILVAPDRPALLQVLGPVTKGLSQASVADLVFAAATPKSPQPVALFGYGGIDRAAAKALAKSLLLSSARAGVMAFNATPRRLGEATEALEATLRYMAYLGDDALLDGCLEFLSQSYTLLEDFGRAVPLLERLIALRKQKVTLALQTKKSKSDVLAAKIKWGKALTDMARLRMRSEEYDRALAENRRTVELFTSLGRLDLLVSAYAEQKIIAEKKGDRKLELAAAQAALAAAQAANPRQSTRSTLEVAGAAVRVAQVFRERFSNYAAAQRALSLALETTVVSEPQQRLEALGKEVQTARTAALAAKDKGAQAKLAAAFQQKQAERSALAERVSTRIAGLLEEARLAAATSEYRKAVARAAEARALAPAVGGQRDDEALLEMVNSLYYLGDYGRALELGAEGLALSKQNPLRKIQFHNARGSAYSALGVNDAAIRELEQALRIAEQQKAAAEMATCHNNIGDAQRRAGHFAAARRAFQRALQIDRQADSRAGMAFDYTNLGLSEELLGRRDDAVRDLQSGLEASRKLDAPLNELKALEALSRIALGQKQSGAGLELARAGLARAEGLGLRNWSWRFHLLVGQGLVAQGQSAAAQKSFEAGLSIVDRAPPRLRRAIGAPKVEAEPADLYDALIDHFAASGNAAQALDVSERQRARTLIDLLAHQVGSMAQGESHGLVERIDTLQTAVEAARAQHARDLARHKRTSGLQALEEQLVLAARQLGVKDENLARLSFGDYLPYPTLAPRLAKVNARTVIVAFAVTATRVWIFTIRGGKLTLGQAQVGRAGLERKVDQLRQALTRFHEHRDLAQELYRRLLGPAGLVPGAADELVLVPSGPLHVLPFAALHDGQDYLAAHLALSSTPSLGALFRERGAATRAKEPIRATFASTGSGQAPLTFTVHESNAFVESFPGAQQFVGPAASKARFLEAAERAGILHVATHAGFRDDAPLLSTLELGDGELPLTQVLSRKLPSSTVILSGCETGVGQLDGADGAVGLSSAFLAAGANLVVSSLFRESDLGSALLMKHFFRALSKGHAPAQALAIAQRALRTRFPHPGFWAGFRLDTGSLPTLSIRTR